MKFCFFTEMMYCSLYFPVLTSTMIIESDSLGQLDLLDEICEDLSKINFNNSKPGKIKG